MRTFCFLPPLRLSFLTPCPVLSRGTRSPLAMRRSRSAFHFSVALADTAFAYACNSRNVATVAQSASILFLSPGQVGEELVAEASEDAIAGRSGAYSVAIRTRDGRPVAQFQGHSRAVGGPLIDDESRGDSHG